MRISSVRRDGGVIVCSIMVECDTLNLKSLHVYLQEYLFICGDIWMACSTQKGDVQKSTLKNESTPIVRTF